MTPPERIVLFITDDQRARPDGAGQSTMDRLPQLLDGLGGVSYPNFFVTTPVCGPSRASMFSGLYASQHGAVTNEIAPMLSYSPFWSVQRRLSLSGWRCGIVGKYLNHIHARDAPYFESAVGPGGQALDEVEKLRARLADYFAAADGRREFLVFSTSIPHGPYLAEPQSAYAPPSFVAPPSFGEADRSDKHPALAGFDVSLEEVEYHFDGQMRELAALDELMGDFFAHLAANREQTLIFFCSDNGYMWGEHGLTSKQWPYLESSHCPLQVSWPDRLADGATDLRVAANIDFASTILDAAELTPDYPMAGASLLSGPPRDWLYQEMAVRDSTPPWRSYLAGDMSRHYIEWRADRDDPRFIEDYDLTADPYELSASNASDPAIEALLDGVDLTPVANPASASPVACG